MKKLFGLALILLSLSACTGTKEVGVPRLLIIGSGGDEPKLSLIQDVFFSDSTASSRFQFLKSLALPAAPIAYDVVDRALERPTLIVISQNDTDTFLSFVNLAGINPDAPDAFRLSSNLALSSLLAEDEDRPFAPVKLQVSKNGRYLAISNELDTINALDIIDLEASTGPSLLRRFSDRILAKSLFLEQAESSSRLFFFIEQASGAVLSYFNLPSLSLNNSSFTLPNSRSDAPIDLQGFGNQLVSLQSNSFTPINTPTGSPSAGTTLSTVEDALRFIPGNSSNGTAVLILTEDELGAHRSLTSELQRTSFSAKDGSIEPVGGFAYFISDGSSPLKLFDVQTFQNNLDADINRLIQNYSITDPNNETTPLSLSDTVFISWAISEPPLILP